MPLRVEESGTVEDMIQQCACFLFGYKVYLSPAVVSNYKIQSRSFAFFHFLAACYSAKMYIIVLSVRELQERYRPSIFSIKPVNYFKLLFAIPNAFKHHLTSLGLKGGSSRIALTAE